MGDHLRWRAEQCEQVDYAGGFIPGRVWTSEQITDSHDLPRSVLGHDMEPGNAHVEILVPERGSNGSIIRPTTAVSQSSGRGRVEEPFLYFLLPAARSEFRDVGQCIAGRESQPR